MAIWSLVLVAGLGGAASLESGADAGPDLGSAGLYAFTPIGRPSAAGSVAYDAARERYVLRGGGAAAEGEGHFAWRLLRGDFLLRTRATVDLPRQASGEVGWMVRSGLERDAAFAAGLVDGNGGARLVLRRRHGGAIEELVPRTEMADVLQLGRRGDRIVFALARFGGLFERLEVESLDLGEEVHVGLFVSFPAEDGSASAIFDDVRIVRPAPAGLVPYEEYLGSRLEILDVATGRRRIVLTADDSMQAPNWTPDGTALLFNRNGRIYRLDLATSTVAEVDTGFADRNNNDHVLSFDGTMLGISHHAEDAAGASIVYVLPATGGLPRRVTARGPSYLHGFSPDGRHLVYTAERDGEYDIYRIPVEGGEEVRLTDAPGLDDGSEYSPDGRHVYFNSVRSGSMEIWRMLPDGSAPEQLTRDELNNWFPHVSPDGRRVVFLSYGPEVDPGDHPFYRQVYLRLMSVGGGEPRVVAYLYGGQGTINVPSWAPDSRRLAFISNSASLEPASAPNR